MNVWHVDNDILTMNNAPINEMKIRGQIIMLFNNNIDNKDIK